MQQNTRNYATHLEAHTPPILNVARRLEVLYQQTALIDQRKWCAEISDLEDEITASPATSLSEAAVQMMLASAYVERAREDLVDDMDAMLAKLDRLMQSALAAFVRETGIDLSEYGGDRYLPRKSDRFGSDLFCN